MSVTSAHATLTTGSPVSSPPAGVTAHLDQTPSDLPLFVALITVISALCAGFTAIHLYVKTCLLKRKGWDDVILVIGTGLFISYLATAIFAYRHGITQHAWNLSIGQYAQAMRYTYYCAIFYDIANIFIRTAILVQYRMIFSVRKKDFIWWSTHILTGIIVVFQTIQTFFRIFSCTPTSRFWNILEDGWCYSEGGIQLSSSLFNAVMDLLTISIPQGVIWKMHISLERKIRLAAIFFVGLCACGSSIARAYFSIREFHTSDPSTDLSAYSYCNVAEMFFGILVATLPMTPRFFQKIKATYRSLTSARKTISDGYMDESSFGMKNKKSPAAWPTAHKEGTISKNTTVDVRTEPGTMDYDQGW